AKDHGEAPASATGPASGLGSGLQLGANEAGGGVATGLWGSESARDLAGVGTDPDFATGTLEPSPNSVRHGGLFEGEGAGDLSIERTGPHSLSGDGFPQLEEGG
ncbi:unnamed protein product, partial [Discosporangium mesarthrocarpum]